MPMPRLAVAPAVREASSQPAKPGERAGQDEGDEDHAADLDAGAEGRGGVAADQEEVPAERRLGQDQREDEIGEDQRPGEQRDAEEALDRHDPHRVGQAVDRAAAGERHHDAADRDVGGERDDEGVDAEADDEDAVDRVR